MKPNADETMDQSGIHDACVLDQEFEQTTISYEQTKPNNRQTIFLTYGWQKGDKYFFERINRFNLRVAKG
jgi:hypothetical protein